MRTVQRINLLSNVLITLVIVTLVPCIVSTEPAAAQGTLDQQWAPPFGGAGWNWVEAHQPIGQSFIPTLSVLLAVDVGLENTGSGTQRIAIQIRENSISGTYWQTGGVEVPPGGPIWLHVTLDQPLPVTPGKTYVLAVYVDPGLAPDVRWYITIPGGGYPGGNAITSGINQADGDYLFRTYGTATASSGPAAETDAATDITATSAVLHGVVTTNGKDTLWVFGHVQGYYNLLPPHMGGVNTCPAGDSSNWGYVPAGVGTQPASCQVTGLQPSTTYSFVLADCWASACTSVYGSTLTFTTLPAAAPFDFTFSVSPSTVSVVQGGTAHFAVQLTYSDPSYAGTFINVQLAGLGPGMDYQLSQSGDLAVTASQTTPTGSYSIVLTGSANGVTHQTGMTLIVTSTQSATTAVTTTPSTTTSARPFDYSIAISPSTQSVQIGGSTSFVVSVLASTGSPVPVSLTLEGLPSDVHSSFTTQSAIPPFTSTLDLDLSTSSASAGAYALTVVASASGNVKTATATLTITAKSAQTQTTNSPTVTSIGGNWSDMLQQNSLIVIIALFALAVVLGVLAMRGRGRRTITQQVGAPRTFCGKCGAENPTSNEFCGSCGSKLKES